MVGGEILATLSGCMQFGCVRGKQLINCVSMSFGKSMKLDCPKHTVCSDLIVKLLQVDLLVIKCAHSLFGRRIIHALGASASGIQFRVRRASQERDDSSGLGCSFDFVVFCFLLWHLKARLL